MSTNLIDYFFDYSIFITSHDIDKTVKRPLSNGEDLLKLNTNSCVNKSVIISATDNILITVTALYLNA